ncbi:MAG: DUF4388 domain-containing protein [Gemmatimonadetes bacterium]|nr:MAG: DUF4388 domain-containing protein [Gemmatimonadota bacterium]
MSLHGSLDDFHLIEVLQFLVSAQKTGILAVDLAGEKKPGEIAFCAGSIVQAKYQKQDAETAFYAIIAKAEGNFQFNEKSTIKQKGITTPTVELLANSSRQSDPKDTAETGVALDAVIHLASNPPEESAAIELTPEEWRVLMQIDGQHTLRQIAEAARMTPAQVSGILHTLTGIGLVEKAPHSGKKLRRVAALLCERLLDQYRRLRGPKIAAQLEMDFNAWLAQTGLSLQFVEGELRDPETSGDLDEIATRYRRVLEALVTIIQEKIGQKHVDRVWQNTLKNTSELELNLIEEFRFDKVFSH